MAVDKSREGFRLLDLPAEIREHIYSYIFDPSAVRTSRGEGYFAYEYNLALFRVNRQIYYESRKVFRQLNIFVRVETPWEEAEEHVAVDGHVPVLITDELVDGFDGFNDHMLAIEIDAHQREGHYVTDRPKRKFVILIDDLDAFTRMWSYSDLSYGGRLNPNLNLTLRVRNPYAQSYEDGHLPKAVQMRLLEPFGRVKGIRDLEITGDHYASLGKKLRDAMAVPYEPPDKCLQEGTKLKDEGNAALNKKDPKRAIELYIRAFEKIHIICDGRRRSIWGDAWFDRQFTNGPFKNKHGQVVRLVLRSSLVANMIKAYLDLGNYEEAKFWGIRSIRLVRDTVGLGFDDDDRDEPLLNFPASNQMGKIYYRTGVACKALGETDEAKKLLRVAKLYLPRDESIQKELSAVSVSYG